MSNTAKSETAEQRRLRQKAESLVALMDVTDNGYRWDVLCGQLTDVHTEYEALGFGEM